MAYSAGWKKLIEGSTRIEPIVSPLNDGWTERSACQQTVFKSDKVGV